MLALFIFLLEGRILMRRVLLLLAISCMLSSVVFSTVFGIIRGIVHDPQHRPVSDVTITLKGKNSTFTLTSQTDASGEFHFDAVPLGEYTIMALDDSFARQTQEVTVFSGSAPILHFELRLASQNQSITVSADSASAQTELTTPSSMVDREEIRRTPGASQTNSLAMITDYVPGAYVTHDQLHVRGGHQVSWLIDGVPIPNTNIASNLGPQIDPKDIDYVEVARGSYRADVGDRTYGVFDVVPRSGFERNRQGEVVFSLGNFYQTNDQLSLGNHSQKFAWYTSLNGNRSQYGLQPPI